MRPRATRSVPAPIDRSAPTRYTGQGADATAPSALTRVPPPITPGTTRRTAVSPRSTASSAHTPPKPRSPPGPRTSRPHRPPAAAPTTTTARRPSPASSNATSSDTYSPRLLPMLNTGGATPAPGARSRQSQNPRDDVVDIREVPLQPPLLVERDRPPRHDRLGKAVIRHVRPPPRPIHGKKPQPRHRQPIQMPVRSALISSSARFVAAYNETGVSTGSALREWQLGITSINRRRTRIDQMPRAPAGFRAASSTVTCPITFDDTYAHKGRLHRDACTPACAARCTTRRRIRAPRTSANSAALSAMSSRHGTANPVLLLQHRQPRLASTPRRNMSLRLSTPTTSLTPRQQRLRHMEPDEPRRPRDDDGQGTCHAPTAHVDTSIPPSIETAAPVIVRDASEHRNTASPPSPSGVVN